MIHCIRFVCEPVNQRKWNCFHGGMISDCDRLSACEEEGEFLSTRCRTVQNFFSDVVKYGPIFRLLNICGKYWMENRWTNDKWNNNRLMVIRDELEWWIQGISGLQWKRTIRNHRAWKDLEEVHVQCWTSCGLYKERERGEDDTCGFTETMKLIIEQDVFRRQ